MTNDGPEGDPPRKPGGSPSGWRVVARRLQIPEDSSWLIFSTIAAVVVFAGVATAALLDPEAVSWFPKCPLHALTGLDCPGCGTARAVHAAAHGDFRSAIRFNAILVVAVPFLVAIVAKPQWARSTKVAWSVFSVAVGWMVFRNLFL